MLQRLWISTATLIINLWEKNLNHLMQTALGIGLATIIGVSYPRVGRSQTSTPTPAVHDG